MSAPHIILDFCHLCAKNFQIRWKFDVDYNKINFACSCFLRHGVDSDATGYVHCTRGNFVRPFTVDCRLSVAVDDLRNFSVEVQMPVYDIL